MRRQPDQPASLSRLPVVQDEVAADEAVALQLVEVVDAGRTVGAGGAVDPEVDGVAPREQLAREIEPAQVAPMAHAGRMVQAADQPEQRERAGGGHRDRPTLRVRSMTTWSGRAEASPLRASSPALPTTSTSAWASSGLQARRT